MYTAVLADDFLHMATSGRKYKKVATDGHFTYGSLCELALQHNIQAIWLVPGSKISTKLEEDPGVLNPDSQSWYEIRERREESSGIPKFASIRRKEGTYQEKRLVFIGIPEHDPNWSDSSGWALADIEDAITLLGAICYIQEATGVPILFSPGYTGIELLKDMHKHHSWLQASDVTMLPRYTEKDILYCRSLTKGECNMKYLHIFDRNGQYLAGGTGAECGEGEPVRVSGPAYDKTRCGIWYVEASPAPDGFPAPLIGDYCVTPLIEAMVFMGMRVNIHGGWMWKNHHRTMNTWCKRWWDTRLELRTDSEKYPNREAAETAAKMSKIIPNRAISWLDLSSDRGSTKNPLHRPDIRNQLVGMARARMFMTMMRIYNLYRVKPIAVRTDEVVYASDNPDIDTALPELTKRRDELGGFKPVGTLAIDENIIMLLGSEESDFAKITILHNILSGNMAGEQVLNV